MYVYIKNWSIIRKSKEQLQIDCDCFLSTTYGKSEKIIYENGWLVKYEESEQYKKDIGLKDLKTQNIILKEENKALIKKTDETLSDFERAKKQFELLKFSHGKTPWWEPIQWLEPR